MAKTGLPEAVLLLGNGGREHVLADEMMRSPNPPDRLLVAPGNPGTAAIEGAQNATFGSDDRRAILGWVGDRRRQGMEPIVVVGPEKPLVAGLGDILRAEGAAVFGPNKEAAMLEGSKIAAAEFMQANRIPHPQSTVVRTLEEARAAVRGRERYIVIKAAGLAGGKGVVLPGSPEEADQTLCLMFNGEGFDGAGKAGVVIQERLTGPELSVFVIADGKGGFSIVPFMAQDHKRLKDDDRGPNTGGMGAYAPIPEGMLTEQQIADIQYIAEQTIKGLAKRGTPYQGVLYMGLMLADERNGQPVVIEYNCRWGDPEAQVVLPLLRDNGTDVYDLLRNTARGDLTDLGTPVFAGRSAVAVTLAAPGYPGKPQTGAAIHGLDRQYPNATVYQAGTRRAPDGPVTDGGRVLTVTGMAENLGEARERAYGAIGAGGVWFDGAQLRHDIALRAARVARESGR